MNPAALFSLSGRTALVTGGTGGLGTMIARGLLGAGARVLITGRDAAACAGRARELSALGPCTPMVADLATPEGVEALAATVRAQAPELDILVNNAGRTARAPLGDYPADYWDELMGLNVRAPFLLTQALFPTLKANASADRPAHVINIGSIAALVTTTPDSFAYGPSKAALHHVTRVLARRFAPDHVCVNAVAPGLFPSEMSAWLLDDPELSRRTIAAIPAGRAGRPEDMARMIVFIAASAYLTGTVVPLDGGLSL